MTHPIRTEFPWFPQINDDSRVWAGVPTVTLPTQEIGFAQDYVRVDGMLRHADANRPGWEGQPVPRAIYLDGRWWIVNGTHRSLLAVLRHEPFIEAQARTWP